jgi:hypothetical protein
MAMFDRRQNGEVLMGGIDHLAISKMPHFAGPDKRDNLPPSHGLSSYSKPFSRQAVN